MVEHGKDAKNDAWYWHFIEYGTVNGIAAKPFMQPAIDEIKPVIPAIYKE